MWYDIVSPTDPTLNLANLKQLMEYVDDLEEVCTHLCIHESVYDDIMKQHGDEPVEALCEWYLTNHPAPSWRHVAYALYESKEQDVLTELRILYLKGI